MLFNNNPIIRLRFNLNLLIQRYNAFYNPIGFIRFTPWINNAGLNIDMDEERFVRGINNTLTIIEEPNADENRQPSNQLVNSRPNDQRSLDFYERVEFTRPFFLNSLIRYQGFWIHQQWYINTENTIGELTVNLIGQINNELHITQFGAVNDPNIIRFIRNNNRHPYWVTNTQFGRPITHDLNNILNNMTHADGMDVLLGILNVRVNNRLVGVDNHIDENLRRQQYITLQLLLRFNPRFMAGNVDVNTRQNNQQDNQDFIDVEAFRPLIFVMELIQRDLGEILDWIQLIEAAIQGVERLQEVIDNLWYRRLYDDFITRFEETESDVNELTEPDVNELTEPDVNEPVNNGQVENDPFRGEIKDYLRLSADVQSAIEQFTKINNSSTPTHLVIKNFTTGSQGQSGTDDSTKNPDPKGPPGAGSSSTGGPL